MFIDRESAFEEIVGRPLNVERKAIRENLCLTFESADLTICWRYPADILQQKTDPKGEGKTHQDRCCRSRVEAGAQADH